MKKLYIFTTLLLISCVTDPHTAAQRNAEQEVQKLLHDPSSYEFVSFELIDTITYADNIKYRRDYFKERIEMARSLPEVYGPESVQSSHRILSNIDDIEESMGESVNEVASRTYLFKFRATNRVGATGLNSFFVQTDPQDGHSIINMVKRSDEVYLNPNDFPGYREMVNNQ